MIPSLAETAGIEYLRSVLLFTNIGIIVRRENATMVTAVYRGIAYTVRITVDGVFLE